MTVEPRLVESRSRVVVWNLHFEFAAKTVQSDIPGTTSLPSGPFYFSRPLYAMSVVFLFLGLFLTLVATVAGAYNACRDIILVAPFTH